MALFGSFARTKFLPPEFWSDFYADRDLLLAVNTRGEPLRTAAAAFYDRPTYAFGPIGDAVQALVRGETPAPGAAPAPPVYPQSFSPPMFPALGAFTTRRTQLFGPLANLSAVS